MEQVEVLQTTLQGKADQAALQETKQQVQEGRQQGQATSNALAQLEGSLRQQGQEQAAAVKRLEALLTKSSQGEQHAVCAWPCLSVAFFRLNDHNLMHSAGCALAPAL